MIAFRHTSIHYYAIERQNIRTGIKMAYRNFGAENRSEQFNWADVHLSSTDLWPSDICQKYIYLIVRSTVEGTVHPWTLLYK
jgi:hypothetical protein